MFLIRFQLAHKVLHDGRGAGISLVFHALDVLQVGGDLVNVMLQHNHAEDHALSQSIPSAHAVVITLCRETNTCRYWEYCRFRSANQNTGGQFLYLNLIEN